MSELHVTNKRLGLQDDVVEELQEKVGKLEDTIAALSNDLEATERAYLALKRVWLEVHPADIDKSLVTEIETILLEIGLIR